MASTKKNDKPEEQVTTPSAADAAEAEGRAAQATEKAADSGDPEKIEEAARTEEAPKPDPDTPKNPEASANPTEVLGPSDSEPNQMSTAGLNPIQRARVEGTPIDGTNGANFVQDHPDVAEQPRAARSRSRSRG